LGTGIFRDSVRLFPALCCFFGLLISFVAGSLAACCKLVEIFDLDFFVALLCLVFGRLMLGCCL